MTQLLESALAHQRMLKGFGQTTAEITYQRPLEKKTLEVATTLFKLRPQEGIISLQTFMWQFDDLAPKFPRLSAFLEYWGKHCFEAQIEKVRLAHEKLITPKELRYIDSKWYVN